MRLELFPSGLPCGLRRDFRCEFTCKSHCALHRTKQARGEVLIALAAAACRSGVTTRCGLLSSAIDNLPVAA